jgi:DNA-binding transcriptional MerR regulator
VQIPQKLYFRIGEVARLLDVAPHVIRYWESEFDSLRPTKSGAGQRVYTRRDVERLVAIRHLLKEQHYTIQGAKKLLREQGTEPPETNEVIEPEVTDIERSRRLRTALESARERLLHALQLLEPPKS